MKEDARGKESLVEMTLIAGKICAANYLITFVRITKFGLSAMFPKIVYMQPRLEVLVILQEVQIYARILLFLVVSTKRLLMLKVINAQRVARVVILRSRALDVATMYVPVALIPLVSLLTLNPINDASGSAGLMAK